MPRTTTRLGAGYPSISYTLCIDTKRARASAPSFRTPPIEGAQLSSQIFVSARRRFCASAVASTSACCRRVRLVSRHVIASSSSSSSSSSSQPRGPSSASDEKDGCVGHRRDDRARDNRATVVVRASRRLNHTLCAHKPNRTWKRWILNFELKTKAVQRPVVTRRVPPLTTLSEVCTSPRHDRGTPMGMRMRAARGVRFCRSSCRSLFRRPTNSDAPASPPRTSRTWESVT